MHYGMLLLLSIAYSLFTLLVYAVAILCLLFVWVIDTAVNIVWSLWKSL